VDGGLVHLRVAKSLFDRVHALAEQVHAELFEASAGDGGVEVDAFEERVDFDGRLRRGRQGALRAFARRAETTERLGVTGDVLLVLALEFSDEVLQQASVEIFTAQVRVASRRLDFEDALFDGQQGHIKGTTTEIENQNVLFRTVGLISLVQTVRNGRSRRLVDDAQAVQARDDGGVLGRLTLGIVKVRRHGDDGVLHVLTQVRFRNFSHLDQNHGRNLLRGELLRFAVKLDANHRLVRVARLDGERPILDVRLHRRFGELATDQTLGVEHGVLRVHRRLVLRRVPDETFAVREGDVRRRRAVTHIIGDDFNPIVLPDTDAGIRRAEIDPDRGTFLYFWVDKLLTHSERHVRFDHSTKRIVRKRIVVQVTSRCGWIFIRRIHHRQTQRHVI